MYPTTTLGSSGNLKQASDLQTASIVVEAIILVLEIIGIEIPDDENEVKKVINIVIEELGRYNTLLQDVEKIRNDRDDLPAIAKDIFVLVVDAFHDGIFWKIVKALLSDMPWYDCTDWCFHCDVDCHRWNCGHRFVSHEVSKCCILNSMKMSHQASLFF